jgi:hypothetical protein
MGEFPAGNCDRGVDGSGQLAMQSVLAWMQLGLRRGPRATRIRAPSGAAIFGLSASGAEPPIWAAFRRECSRSTGFHAIAVFLHHSEFECIELKPIGSEGASAIGGHSEIVAATPRKLVGARRTCTSAMGRLEEVVPVSERLA